MRTDTQPQKRKISLKSRSISTWSTSDLWTTIITKLDYPAYSPDFWLLTIPGNKNSALRAPIADVSDVQKDVARELKNYTENDPQMFWSVIV